MELVTGFVLAGGNSSRMGQDKGLICWRGQPLVQRATDLLREVCGQVFLLAPAGRYPFLDLPCIEDRFAGGGPLVALLSGLHRSGTDLNLFLPCDMPFLTPEVLLKIVSLAEGADAAVPQDDRGRWFPLSAGYRRSCLSPMERSVAKGIFRADSFFPEIVVRPLPTRDFPEAVFANINSPSDLARWIVAR